VLATTFADAFPEGADLVAASVAIAGHAGTLLPDLALCVIAEREPPNQEQVLFALDRSLHDRGDKNIGSRADWIAKSTFFSMPPTDGDAAPGNVRLEALVTRTRRFTGKRGCKKRTRKLRITVLDRIRWNSRFRWTSCGARDFGPVAGEPWRGLRAKGFGRQEKSNGSEEGRRPDAAKSMPCKWATVREKRAAPPGPGTK
jgi:hypothetical protein